MDEPGDGTVEDRGDDDEDEDEEEEAELTREMRVGDRCFGLGGG